MVTDSQINIEKLEAQIRECYGRLVYSHKTQEKCADLCFERLHYIKWAYVILSSITTGGIIISLFGTNKWSLGIAAICSLLLTVLTAYNKEYDLGEIGQKHKEAANNLWNIRESYLSLIADIQANAITPKEARQKRDELQGGLSNIYKGVPTSMFANKAYKFAQIGLQKEEEMTFSEGELDSLMPPDLRRNRK